MYTRVFHTNSPEAEDFNLFSKRILSSRFRSVNSCKRHRNVVPALEVMNIGMLKMMAWLYILVYRGPLYNKYSPKNKLIFSKTKRKMAKLSLPTSKLIAVFWVSWHLSNNILIGFILIKLCIRQNCLKTIISIKKINI